MITADEPVVEIRVPTAAVVGAAVLMVLCLCLAAAARATGVGAVRAPAAPAAEVVRSRAVLFADRADGGVEARDAATGRTLALVPPGTNGFLRGTLRGLSRGRRMRGVPPETPYRVSALADGRLLLEDPTTGVSIDLRAFGPTNSGAFAGLLPPAPGPTALSSLPRSPEVP